MLDKLCGTNVLKRPQLVVDDTRRRIGVLPRRHGSSCIDSVGELRGQTVYARCLAGVGRPSLASVPE